MKRWIYVLVPLLILGALIVWRIGQKRAEVAEQATMREMRMKMPSTVTTEPAQVRDIANIFEATGTVESPQNVKIAPKLAGRIDYLEVREGDRVRKGQVLVRIDPTEIEAQALQKKAELAEARFRLAQAQLNQTPADMSVNTQIRQQKAAVTSATADYNQVKQNYESQVAAASANVTDIQSRVENAKAAMKSAQANLNNATSKYNRVMELYKQGYIAAQDVDDAKAAVSVQQSTLEIAQGQLNSATAQKQAAEHLLSIAKTKGKADIEAANAKMLQVKAGLDYANANAAQKPAYQQSLSALRASVSAAEAALRAAEAKRLDTVLISPLDGFVTGRYADTGAMASAGQPILAVQFIKQIWVTIGVPEEISAKIHIGQPVQVKFDAIPERSFTASVIQVNPSADLESRQFMVRVILSNKENLFKPGMFARVSLETDRAKGMTTVPREAVQRDKTGEYVVVVDKSGKAKRVPVVRGASNPEFVAIQNGLQAGESVVTMSAGAVRDGQMVRMGGGKGKRGPK